MLFDYCNIVQVQFFLTTLHKSSKTTYIAMSTVASQELRVSFFYEVAQSSLCLYDNLFLRTNRTTHI